MKLFDKSFFKKSKKCKDCNAKLPKKPFEIKIFGESYEFIEATKCPKCFEDYMNKNCTICNSCRKAIMPFTSVAVALTMEGEEDPVYPFVHLNSNCNPAGFMAFCGDWEEGKLLDLDEMEETGKGNYSIERF